MGAVEVLADALGQFPCLQHPQERIQCMQLVALDTGAYPRVVLFGSTRGFLVSLAQECLADTAVLPKLRRSLSLLGSPDTAIQHLDTVVDRLWAAPVVPTTASERLRRLLAGWEIEHLTDLVRAAAGPLHDVPRIDDPWRAFQLLSAMTAEPDALPPVLALVERLAAVAPQDRASGLRAWVEEQAEELSLTPLLWELRERLSRSAPDDLHDAYLVIQLDPQDETEHYQLTSWLQNDPTGWRPVRSQTVQVDDYEAVERTVEGLVYEAEEQCPDAPRIHLEFVLADEDLNQPVHLMRQELDSGLPSPLCLKYPVVVRSLDRMRKKRWHRVWNQRWRHLRTRPAECRQVVVDGADPDTACSSEPTSLEGHLARHQHVVALALGSPPGTSEGNDQLRLALRYGVPVLWWDSEPARDPRLVERLRLNQANTDRSLAGLRDVVTELRHEAREGGHEAWRHLGRRVVLVWDDPTRPVETHGRLAGPG